MSRLLVIEPNMMLRYAMAMALTPDHLVQFAVDLPDASSLKNADGVIVDVATLRQCGKPFDLQQADHWQIPIVWIDDHESALTKRRDWVTLKPPMERERLLKAIFDCLNPPTQLKVPVKKTEPGTVVAEKKRAKKNQPSQPDVSTSPAPNVIDLIDIVDDEPEDA